MKTALISLITATLLVFAIAASGRLLDAADFIAIVFTTSLVAWTVAQYRGEPRPLALARRIHLPVQSGRLHVSRTVNRHAA